MGTPLLRHPPATAHPREDSSPSGAPVMPRCRVKRHFRRLSTMRTVETMGIMCIDKDTCSIQGLGYLYYICMYKFMIGTLIFFPWVVYLSLGKIDFNGSRWGKLFFVCVL